MNKTKYKVRHIRCNMQDFNMDRHRFRFEYNGKEYVVPVYGLVDCTFDDNDNIPEDVQIEIANTIFKKFDNGEEKKWKYPQEAYDIADEYCRNEFND